MWPELKKKPGDDTVEYEYEEDHKELPKEAREGAAFVWGFLLGVGVSIGVVLVFFGFITLLL